MMTCEKVVYHQPGPGVVKHNMVLDDHGQVLGDLGDPKLSYEAGDELVRLTKAYQLEHNVGYQCAHDIVLGLPENAATVRLYGHAQVTPLEDSPLAELLEQSPATEIGLPPRQVIEIQVESTITSCGYGVPIMSYAQDRTVANHGRKYKPKRTLQT